VDGRLILKCILNKHDVRVWTVLSDQWRAAVNTSMILRVLQRVDSFLIVVASQVGLCCVEVLMNGFLRLKVISW
jgi:hypothetical protein